MLGDVCGQRRIGRQVVCAVEKHRVEPQNLRQRRGIVAQNFVQSLAGVLRAALVERGDLQPLGLRLNDGRCGGPGLRACR